METGHFFFITLKQEEAGKQVQDTEFQDVANVLRDSRLKSIQKSRQHHTTMFLRLAAVVGCAAALSAPARVSSLRRTGRMSEPGPQSANRRLRT